jgi:serine/threonine-protein kinase
MLGTVDYVAPEQVEGSEPDAPGDVYSLACVLYETLTGAPPFADQKGGMAKMWAQVNSEPPSLREQRPDVSPALEDVIGRGMAKDPEARPTAAAFRAAVLQAVGEPL